MSGFYQAKNKSKEELHKISDKRILYILYTNSKRIFPHHPHIGAMLCVFSPYTVEYIDFSPTVFFSPIAIASYECLRPNIFSPQSPSCLSPLLHMSTYDLILFSPTVSFSPIATASYEYLRPDIFSPMIPLSPSLRCFI